VALAAPVGAGEMPEPRRARRRDQTHRVVEAIARLKLPDRKERLRALETIKRFPEKAIPYLVRAARHDDPVFRARVANALGLVGKGGRDALWALAVLLKDPDTFVRREAIAALVNAGDASHIPQVEPLLADSQEVVRADAVRALAQLEPDKAPERMKALLKHDDARVRRTALSCLVEREAPGLGELLPGLLRDADGGMRGDAAAVLADRAWRKVVEAAVKIKAPKARQRFYDAAARTDPRVRQAADTMIGLLSDPDPYVRTTAICRLKQMRARQAIPRLLGLLADENEDVRAEAISALGVLRATTALRALITHLTAPSKRLRERAAFALGFFGKQARPAVPGLILLLSDADKGVRQKADLALRMILRTSVGFQAGASQERRQEAIRKWQEVWRNSKRR